MRCLASAAVMRETVATAIGAGINHLETAQGYGASEVLLGQALRDLDIVRSDIYLTSKLAPMDGAAMAVAIDASLARLQVDYLDGLAIHGLNTPEHLAMVMAPDGALAAVEAAIAVGKVRQVGFSTHGSLDLMLAAIATGRFSFVNLHYGMFFQRHAAAIAAAAERDMGIFIISPGDKAGMLYQPPEQLVADCAPLSPLGANYRWLLSDERITTLSVGPAVPQELDQPLASAIVGPLDLSEQAVFERLAEREREKLGTDRCSQCYACLPCPEGIHIPEVLRLRNLAVAHEMQQFGEYRYGMFERAGHWFPGNKGNRCSDCGDCIPRCPEGLAIPDLLRQTHDLLNGRSRRRLWGD
jgi:uncharacterized protein